jgi:hypothetical protein
MLKDFLTYVAGEWAMISQVPATFVAAVLICAVVIWLFRRSQYVGQIHILNERIRLRDDQIGGLQKSLHAESPADALVKIGELTAKVDALSIGKWDPLTQQQIQATKDRLARIPVSEIRIELVDDARAIGAPLAHIFEELGWKVHGARIIGGGDGIDIFPNSNEAEAIADALRVGGNLEINMPDRPANEPLTISLGGKPF